MPSDTTLSADYRVLRAAPKSPKSLVTVVDTRVAVLKDETARGTPAGRKALHCTHCSSKILGKVVWLEDCGGKA